MGVKVLRGASVVSNEIVGKNAVAEYFKRD